MKKALLMGGIAPFCDLLECAESKNIECVVCDYYEDAPAKKRVSKGYNVSTMDIEKITKIAEENRVNAVVTAFSDRNLLPGMCVANKLGLPSIYREDKIALVTDKLKMKQKLMDAQIPVIPYKMLHIGFADSELSELHFPVVTKPVDAYGSKGIFICQTAEEVRERFEETTKEALVYKEDIIVEEFYPVDEISISGWIYEGKVYVTCIYDVVKNYKGGIELAAVAFPSKYTKKHLENLKLLFQQVIEVFGLTDGPVTLQCFIGNRGLKVSELLYRLAGNSPYLYSCYLGGPNIAGMWLDMCLGEKIDIQNLKEFTPVSEELFFDVQMFVKEAGELKIEFDLEQIKKEIPECADVRWYNKDGDVIINVPESGKLVMRLICQIPDCTEEKYRVLLDRISEKLPIYNSNGDKISFVRKPEKLRLYELYPF